ncbi:helix-turn-helix transcriptional regulator [Ruficoccus amylovorans]|uniref:Helix-turn-helix transcriptional regulator n=2 Tax=Ruficoccus amylovorans TaxID=1804625 RepID=A0A842HHD5_9BACT|nr:helix-turn-helix transcriptional regulator [Ruficoccus amylovorans]
MALAMEDFAKTMATDNLLIKRVRGKVRRVPPVPSNYYSGIRRWSGTFPDNILLFSRSHRRSLPSDDVSSYFHHRWVVIFVLEGEVTIRLDRNPCHMAPGSVILIPPLHFHHYNDVVSEKLCWLFITFDWPGHAAPSASDLKPVSMSQADMHRLESVLATWAAQDDPMCGSLLSVNVLGVLLELFPILADRKHEEEIPSGEPEMVAAVRQLLTENPHRSLSVEDVAGLLGISASHLRAEFRARAGISLGRYMREWRLREAALLLSSSELSVKDTAERLGFRDIYAFSRSFTHTLGMTPSSLRPKNRSQKKNK